jgi:hypothetical protein
MKNASLLIVFLQVPDALAAQEIRMLCLPPVRPDIALPLDTLQGYRRELTAEFEQYFTETTLYIACLDAERAAALDEARDVTEAYIEFLAIVPKDEIR